MDFNTSHNYKNINKEGGGRERNNYSVRGGEGKTKRVRECEGHGDIEGE
jgi:hypothetical protein